MRSRALPPVPPPTPPPAPVFEPTPLGKRVLEVTVPRHMRVLPTDVIDEMNVKKRDMLDRFRFDNPRFRLRLKHYVIGSAITFPLVTGLFTPAGFGNLALQVLISAVFGVVLAVLRPRGLFAGLLTVGFGMVILLFCGPTGVNFLTLVCTVLFYLVIGFAIGAQEDLKASDGS